MRFIEASGKTVEDAVKVGLTELKCDSADVNIDILEMGSPGLFGMFGRLARVRLTVKEDDREYDEIKMPVMTLEAQKPRAERKPQPEKRQPKEKQAEPVEKQSEPRVDSKPAKQAPKAAPKPARQETKPAAETTGPVIKTVAEFKASRGGTRETERKPESAPRQTTAPIFPVEPFEPFDAEKAGESAKCAYDFLSNVTKLMGVEVTIRMKEAEGHLYVQMNGDALGILIGRRGETLDALQYLTSLNVNKGCEEYTRVSLDSENYRAKREEALRKLAARMASRARKTGRRVALEPMNPYERRVMHSALQGNPYVTTHSEGEEPYRRVIITLK